MIDLFNFENTALETGHIIKKINWNKVYKVFVYWLRGQYMYTKSLYTD